jgi:Leucine-rich repeat (LRR) protein
MMKKLLLLGVFVCATVLLSGCSVDATKEKLANAFDRIMQKDQVHEQGFEVTTEMLTERLHAETGYLELSKMDLTTIPDICGLMPVETHPEIAFLSLAQNNIRVVNQDLSCLTNLRVLNLSYNNIVEVVKLGELPNLQELLLHKNNLETADTIVEMELPALQKLNLAYNNIKEVANIDRFKNLTVLELQHNAIQSIVGVENLEKLEELKLEFNKLTDLPFLENLTSLKSLTTEGNELKATLEAKIKELQQKFRNGWNTGTVE